MAFVFFNAYCIGLLSPSELCIFPILFSFVSIGQAIGRQYCVRSNVTFVRLGIKLCSLTSCWQFIHGCGLQTV